MLFLFTACGPADWLVCEMKIFKNLLGLIHPFIQEKTKKLFKKQASYIIYKKKSQEKKKVEGMCILPGFTFGKGCLTFGDGNIVMVESMSFSPSRIAVLYRNLCTACATDFFG